MAHRVSGRSRCSSLLISANRKRRRDRLPKVIVHVKRRGWDFHPPGFVENPPGWDLNPRGPEDQQLSWPKLFADLEAQRPKYRWDSVALPS